MTAPLDEPLLRVTGLHRHFPRAASGMQRRGEANIVQALAGASLELWPGEVLAIVGESGSGKSTLLDCITGQQRPDAGQVHYRQRDGQWLDVHQLGERERRRLNLSDWGYVEQQAAQGLRMSVSAGANLAEPAMALAGSQIRPHYGDLRQTALDWMAAVELDGQRIDTAPRHYSGGMRKRLQIARKLVTRPRLVLMDEPTAGLDVSVQARLLDLIRELVDRMQLSVLLVTHDLGVARLLAHRTLVMQAGRIVEEGLTDRVLDDPQHAYTQLLVASVLTA